MTSFVKVLLTVTCVCGLSTVLAQKPKPAITKPVVAKPAQRFIPPKLTSMLGIRSGDTVSVYLEEAVQLVTFPLKVADDKKSTYNIASYQLMYKKRGVTESEDMSGKTAPVMTTVIGNFKTTPLSPIWIKSLTEQLKIGEELYFFDIVAKDAQGRLMFAPDLRIKVK
jgi:hypothetical protein